ncbi:hypothetical protein [Actinomadura fibrosa]|uniref:Secreted protein n=1 Tax=Actinomadura fibrosa TaxID=111802 RepID=A0ABW2XJZ1_9ACTN|nr:hypothetical protein [Actinomadura fibrosa]
MDNHEVRQEWLLVVVTAGAALLAVPLTAGALMLGAALASDGAPLVSIPATGNAHSVVHQPVQQHGDPDEDGQDGDSDSDSDSN